MYVDRLTSDISERDLKNHFSQFGEITDVCIPKSSGAYGIVTSDNAPIKSLRQRSYSQGCACPRIKLYVQPKPGKFPSYRFGQNQF